MANNNKKYRIVGEQLIKCGGCTARQLSLKIKDLSPHQIAGILSIFEKHNIVEKVYSQKYGCFVWKPKNLNISSINDILEKKGGNSMSEEKSAVPMVKYKGQFIPLSEYEEKIKTAAKPVGKLAQERWLPLLKFLSKQEAPVPLKEIITALGPKIANSIFTLRNKGYVILAHRKYSITPKGEEYLAELTKKLAEKPEVPEEPQPIEAEAKPKAAPKPAAKPSKAPEPEEIF